MVRLAGSRDLRRSLNRVAGRRLVKLEVFGGQMGPEAFSRAKALRQSESASAGNEGENRLSSSEG